MVKGTHKITGAPLDYPRIYMGWCAACGKLTYVTVQCYRDYNAAGRITGWQDTHVCKVGHTIGIVVPGLPAPPEGWEPPHDGWPPREPA